jgi:hypothetical protein
MQFSLIISNPPYNSGVDLKILQEVWNLSDTIVFVHPSTWLYDKKGNSKLFKETKQLTEDHVTHAEEVIDSNVLFNIELFQNVFITKFEKNPNPENIIDLNDIDIHKNSVLINGIFLKILTYCKKRASLQDVLVHKSKEGHWECGISGIRGHYQNPDLYTFIRKVDPDMHVEMSTRYHLKFPFLLRNEALNFREYLKLKVVRFCLSLYKINQHCDSGELKAVPFMSTYMHPWSNYQVAQELELTTEELDYMINWVPNYYDNDHEQSWHL